MNGEQKYPILCLFLGLPLMALVSFSCRSGELTEAEERAVLTLQTVVQAQDLFQQRRFFDNDDNGVGDFGTFTMLADPVGKHRVPPLIDPILTTGRFKEYRYIMKVTMGEGTTVAPAFLCVAYPPNDKLRTLYVDETKVIRFTWDGTTPNPSSPVLELASYDLDTSPYSKSK